MDSAMGEGDCGIRMPHGDPCMTANSPSFCHDRMLLAASVSVIAHTQVLIQWGEVATLAEGNSDLHNCSLLSRSIYNTYTT